MHWCSDEALARRSWLLDSVSSCAPKPEHAKHALLNGQKLLCCRCPALTTRWRCCCWRRSLAAPGRTFTLSCRLRPSPRPASDRYDASDVQTLLAGGGLVPDVRADTQWKIVLPDGSNAMFGWSCRCTRDGSRMARQSPSRCSGPTWWRLSAWTSSSSGAHSHASIVETE